MRNVSPISTLLTAMARSGGHSDTMMSGPSKLTMRTPDNPAARSSSAHAVTAVLGACLGNRWSGSFDTHSPDQHLPHCAPIANMA
ncbi:hypothetical protein XHV734_0043 [Xanthomonas hortorum pv. vitians]|nr:hypothetical protein XHV734_0043 [Xanthomonas hortorum pv. vitians]